MAEGTIAILVGPEYEDLEVWYPRLRLEEAGYEVQLVGIGEPHYTGKNGYPCTVDRQVEELSSEHLLGIFAPGGWAPDKIRRNPTALELVREVHEAGRMVATICHGGWVLISAGVVSGKRMTSVEAIKDDLVNAGARWEDAPVVVDGNLVSSRRPPDLPELAKAMLGVLKERSV
ncbi:MAG: type 1 glutamine amidotransferase domain-containing protein [Myxococcota bacterium]